MTTAEPPIATRRAVVLATVALAGGVALAGPAILSEIDNAGAAGLRLFAGLVFAAIGAPMFVIAAWRKPLGPAAVSVFVPPFAAAVLARLFWSDDYSLTHVAIPLSYVTTLVTFVVVRDRDSVAGRCAACGYDVRALPGERCPECGRIPDAAPSPAARRRKGLRHGALLVAVTIVGGLVHTLIIRGLLSLG